MTFKYIHIRYCIKPRAFQFRSEIKDNITVMDTWLLAFLITSGVVILLLILLALKSLLLDGSGGDYSLIPNDDIPTHDIPRDFLNDEEAMKHLAAQFDFVQLSPEEQTAYLKAEEFTKTHPPNFHHTRGKSFTPDDEFLIKDRGIAAFEFEQEQDILSARYLVADKTEIHFHNNDTPYSTATSVLNYSLPVKNRTFSDTVYFEVKVYEYVSGPTNPNGHFAIGLVTKPYPTHFRLPGYNSFSIAYESTGNLKINKPFPTPLQQHQGEQSVYNAQVLPPLEQSDVVGFGYSVLSGTIFITRNGRKMMDIMQGCFVDLYPAIGCFSTNAKFLVNLGQLGFVWVEANVRKYGFVSTHDFKKIGGDRGLATLPDYNNINKDNKDKVLEKGEELPPEYPEGELDFFGRSSRELIREGTSSRYLDMSVPSEKDDKVDDVSDIREPKTSLEGSSPRVTYDPEDIMDERERNYEQATTQREETPLGASKHSLELRASALPGIRSNSEQASSSSSPSVKKSARRKKKSKARSKKSGRNKK